VTGVTLVEAFLPATKWHTFQHRIVLNTVGEANGIVEAWFDGVKVLSSNNMLYRKTEDIAINLFYFSTFYGGADPSWAPGSDQFIYFDNFRIATTPLPGSGNTLAVADPEPVSALNIIDEAGGSNAAEPEIGAAKATESGGGSFYGLLIGLLVLLRRKV